MSSDQGDTPAGAAKPEPKGEPTDTAETTRRLNRAFRKAVESEPHKAKKRAAKKR